MEFRTAIKREIDKNEVFVGMYHDGLVKINVEDCSSIIITGETGTGKSILLDEILVQLIRTHTSLEMGIIPIDTSGVELNYYGDSRYSMIKAMRDKKESIVVLSKVLMEIDRRKRIIKSAGYKSVRDYNQMETRNLPFIVIAIDDDDYLLREPDVERMITDIIQNIKNLNMLFIMATSDVHNKFFERDDNTLASVLITFDYTNDLEAKKANIPGADDLNIGKFILKYKTSSHILNNLPFDDKIIKETLNK
ncbi:MAG TPA: FtsK/SpoIIIE domain-containing protein [Bacilli bacterium]|jgi:Cdc6-like AAA superfamily ATPase|nr:FtsK/SpoIIIE domain-containing protein [Bacilli bacterium]